MKLTHKNFTDPLLKWFDLHGRKQLPWQQPRSAYRVWLSEIMLQQTQVVTVIPYFLRFVERFPDLATLAVAEEDEVFAHWSGLGFYSRARRLMATARIVHFEHQGEFPRDVAGLSRLPGIGQSTAAAIASLAFDQPTALLDGNVKRVLSRYFLVEGCIEDSKVTRQLWQLAQDCMPGQRCADYSQAIMDFGATCCRPKQPVCSNCPLTSSCQAYAHNTVDRYPQKKPKTARPTKQQQFILFHNRAGQIYLEKNPATGIWGSLWSLPCRENLPKLATAPKTLKPILRLKHSFSHYHLEIEALSYGPANHRGPGAWFGREELNRLGIAKPISVIIETFLAGLNRVLP